MPSRRPRARSYAPIGSEAGWSRFRRRRLPTLSILRRPSIRTAEDDWAAPRDRSARSSANASERDTEPRDGLERERARELVLDQQRRAGPHRRRAGGAAPAARALATEPRAPRSLRPNDRRGRRAVRARRGAAAATAAASRVRRSTALAISVRVQTHVTMWSSSDSHPRTRSLSGSATINGTSAEASQYLKTGPPAPRPTPPRD